MRVIVTIVIREKSSNIVGILLNRQKLMGKNQNTSSEDGGMFNISKRESKKYLMADTSLQSIELNDDDENNGGLYHSITNQGNDSTMIPTSSVGAFYY